jgi:hypothetical protein
MKKNIFLALLAALLPVALLAQTPQPDNEPELDADRPGVTQSPTVVPRSSWQVEAGLQYKKEELPDFKLKELLYPEVLLRFGVLEWAELRLGTAYKQERRDWEGGGAVLTNRSSGLENLQLGAKVNLFEGRGAVPEIGLLANLVLPVGKEEFRPPHAAPEGRLLFNSKLSEKFELQYNAGYRKYKDQEEYRGEAIYSVAGNLKLTDDFTLFGEFYGFKAKGETADNTVNTGLLIQLQPNLQWDLIIGTVLSDLGLESKSEPAVFAGTGLSWRIPR